MAFQVGRDEDELSENHEINVTPMIDVMLVLLIIFMVAAPLATVDVAVNLPRSTAAPAERPARPVVLTLRSDLSLVLGAATVDRAGLGPALDARTSGEKTLPVFLRADRAVPYGEVMNVMNLLRSAGYNKVSLVALEGQGK